MGESILVVDDDPALRMVLVGLLSQAGYAARAVDGAQKALEIVEREPVDLVLTDLRMDGMDGMALLRELTAKASDLPVVMISAMGTVPIAVEAMKAGAKEFLMKPFEREEVLATVGRVLDVYVRRASAPPSVQVAVETETRSAAMQECRERMTRAAKSTATVLLRGESGTGKEVAARTIHQAGTRARGPFVVVHCAAIPDALLESELFGYEKGAFTGAMKRKPGMVELADGGTFFLDEIGDVSPPVQVKLLRLIQEKEFQRLGGTHPEKVDVRFIAATHRDLDAMVAAGTFREDLFYRLNVLPIWLPPLRERASDVAHLARVFCQKAAESNGKRAELTSEGVRALEAHSWPGNVRELQSFVERLVVFCDDEHIGADAVRAELGRSHRPDAPAPTSAPAAGSLKEARADSDKQAIEEALARAKGNRALAARLLGISRRTLYTKLDALGIT